MKPFYAFVEKSFSGLANPNNTNDKETGKPFTKCAIELFPEKKSSEDAGEEPSMKTEAELVAAQKDKPAKVDPTPDVELIGKKNNKVAADGSFINISMG